MKINLLENALDYILDFTVSHINLNEDPQAMELFEKIREKMIAHEKFITERLESIKPELQKVKSEEFPYTIIDCPSCFHCGCSFSFCYGCHFRDSDTEDENCFCKECSLYNKNVSCVSCI